MPLQADLTESPDHLRPLHGAAVADIAATVCSAYGRAMPLAVAEALTQLLDSHRVADARELAKVCCFAGRSPGLAAAIDVALRTEALSAD